MSEQIPTVPRAGASSNDYWREMDGATYEEMLRERDTKAYQQQEDFLRGFVASELARVGRPLELLEFGCGFGRHALYLGSLADVRYHGYDFSEKMVAPLREHPPAGLEPIADRLFVGPDIAAAAGGRRFDTVFTVSVLIHNPPEAVSRLLDDMVQVLAPGGTICLVENKLVPVSVFENAWHQGCWLHCYPELVPKGFDLHIGQGLIGTHDVYLLVPNGGAKARFFALRRQGDGNGAPHELSRTDLDAMSVPKIRAWAQSVQGAVQQPDAQFNVRIAELEEMLRAERRREERRRRMSSLADDLATLRSARSPAPSRQLPALPPPEAGAPAQAVLWDEPLDTHWSQVDARFARVIHVFHQEWHGIRAHAGYTPGHKLAITCRRALTVQEQRRVLEGCADRLVRVIVFHGYSAAADELARVLRKALGGGVRICFASLGNTAQLHLEFEHQMFTLALRRRQQGVLNGIACVKADMHLASDLIFPKTLISIPPRIPDGRPQVRGSLSGGALIPVPNDWRKNFYTNLFAAERVERLRRIVVTTDFRDPPGSRRGRIIRTPPPERPQMFRLMRDSDVILNASLTECQPMTALEGLALGTPCLTGPLSLGDLDLHPYQRLTQLRAVDSLREVRDGIERLLDLRERSPQELDEMMVDYSGILCAEAFRRYGEFLEV
jgi:SAM-dependent methyltransferase